MIILTTASIFTEFNYRHSSCRLVLSDSLNFILLGNPKNFNMPNETHRKFISLMVLVYPKIFRADNKVEFYLVSNCKAPATKLFSVKDHLRAAKHMAIEAI